MAEAVFKQASLPALRALIVWDDPNLDDPGKAMALLRAAPWAS